MKKLYFLKLIGFFSIALLTHHASAQNQRFSIGPKIGANVSRFTGSDLNQYKGMAKFKPGFTGGLYMLSRLNNKKWNFEAAILITNRGNVSRYFAENEQVNGAAVDYSYTFKTNYVEVPLLIRYNFFNNFKDKTYLLFGPTYGGLFKARREQTSPRLQDIDVHNQLQRDDFGISVGLGQTFFIVDRWYSFEIRYFNSVRNANDYDGIRRNHLVRSNEISDIAKFYNSTLSFTFSVGLERNVAYGYK